ncbi:serine hydrolase [Actinorhabdospora filicis]|uniref:Serine hydrolase n=1 Tax=Actinorhabdospora filicis TaxID=1785913 RepID=A0A9W6WCF5_9ACTN|nr:serine hydrolase domain-containing protein [Actinorhabdospora filicis]GLZ80541.1 serine hydrolase [Actinorhabdospora filicis]
MTEDKDFPTTFTTRERVERPELQQAIEEIAAKGFTGIHMRVNDERGEWTGSAGLAELGGTEAPSTEGHFRIGSNTKTFTAVLVLQLVAEGRVGLEDVLADHLPEFGLDRRITVRMILQHTSGLFNFTGEYFEDGTVTPGIDWSGRAWVENRFRTYTDDELVRFALARPARFEPGADWSYANTNYVLARLLVERLTGRPIAEETHRRVLDPLALTGTIVPGTATDLPEPYAHAYYRYDVDGVEQTTDVSRQNPSWISAGGDMISTTRDLHRFITALVTGKLLPRELMEEMFTPHPKVPYGLGVMIQPVDGGGTVITHNGGIAGHAALMYATPDGRTTMTASLNYVDDAGLSLSTTFQEAVGRLITEIFGGETAE